MAFRKLVGSYKDYTLSTHVIEAGYLAVDVDTGSLRIGDGITAGGTEVGGGSANSLGDLGAIGSTLSAPSNADMTLQTSGTGSVIVNDTFQIGSGAGVTTILDEDDLSSNSATALATQQSIKAYVDSQDHANQTGDLSIVGSTIGSPSNADLTLISSNGNVVIEGIRIAGTTLSTEDSSPGLEIAGNLIPTQNGVFQLGSASKRWQTLFVTAETVDIGGATLKTDDDGAFQFTSLDGGVMEIGAGGAVFPEGSNIGGRAIPVNGTGANGNRPVQLVKIFRSDGSSVLSDVQLLAKTADLTMEFNATVEDVPVFSAGGFGMTMANGSTFASTVATAGRGITLFQF